MIKVLDSICEKIAGVFVEEPIYIQNVPEDFKRPSFFVTMMAYQDTDMTHDFQRRQQSFQIVYFGKKDEYNTVDAVDQYATYAMLSSIFNTKSLQVEDRYLKIDSISGGPKDAEIYMTLKLDYTFTPELLNPEEVYMLMKEINLKFN